MTSFVAITSDSIRNDLDLYEIYNVNVSRCRIGLGEPVELLSVLTASAVERLLFDSLRRRSLIERRSSIANQSRR